MNFWTGKMDFAQMYRKIPVEEGMAYSIHGRTCRIKVGNQKGQF